MSESATEARIRDLQRQLNKEKAGRSEDRRLFQAEIERIWRLVPGYWINLMGAFPPLRKLLHILAEAADLQDPSKGAPYEDTMRTEYTPDGETLTQTERGVLTHRKHRADVSKMVSELEWFTHKISKLIPGQDRGIQYHPPEGECEECGRLLFQSDTGNKRSYCSTKCRVAAHRKRESV